MRTPTILFKIRGTLIFFNVALVVSGATAFPVYSELRWLLEGESLIMVPAILSWIAVSVFLD